MKTSIPHTADERPHILLVDDDEDFLSMMDMRLTREGFKVYMAPNGYRLPDHIREDHPDLILLDIHMNGANGGEICKNLKSDERTRRIPILLFSGNNNIAEIADYCGADGYFSKPLDMAILKQKLTELLDHN